jgi:glucokinase
MPSLALGVDLGGTNARAAVVDRDSGEVVAAHKEPHQDRSAEAVVAEVVGALRSAAAAARIDLQACGQVGVGVAGQCHSKAGTVLNAPNLGWRNVPLGPMLSKELGLPVRIANDLAVAAWGEKRFGAAKGLSDVILVFIGTGVGSAIISRGQLHEGAGGVAGEFGHIKVRPIRPTTAVRTCGCGMTSCLEAYTSGVNLAARVREDLQAGVRTLVRDLVQGDLSRVSAAVVDEAYSRKDPYVIGLWEEVADLMGTAIANYVTVLNPSRVVLGGGVILWCPELERLVRQVFEQQASRTALIGFDFARAHLGDDAGVIGAALLE